MELNNFYKNVVPVADFYDQRKMLTSVGHLKMGSKEDNSVDYKLGTST